MFHLWLEWGVLFGLFPLLIFRGWIPIRFAIPLLAAVALAASWRAASDGAGAPELGWTPFDPDATANCLALGLAAWAALQLTAAAWRIRHQEPVFPFATQQPWVFIMVALVYAISVAAQEFVFRGYFFWRYAGMTSWRQLLLLNIVAFAWAHVIFRSWISIGVTTIGGGVFTFLFARYHSLLGVCIVHYMAGMSIFAMGLGRYFMTASVATARRAVAAAST